VWQPTIQIKRINRNSFFKVTTAIIISILFGFLLQSMLSLYVWNLKFAISSVSDLRYTFRINAGMYFFRIYIIEANLNKPIFYLPRNNYFKQLLQLSFYNQNDLFYIWNLSFELNHLF